MSANDSLPCKLEPTVDAAHRIVHQLLHDGDKQLFSIPKCLAYIGNVIPNLEI